MSFLPVQFLVAVIGTLLAFTIGSVVGLAYGLIDALLLGCGEMLHRWARTCP
jgi:ABC-type dipeptide/oligopeptide/nickel transport system permease subunit